MIHIRKSALDVILWLSLFLAFLFIQIEFLTGDIRGDWVFGISNLLVGFVSIIGISTNRSASSSTSVNLFCLIFMSIIPTVEHKYQITYWGSPAYVIENYAIASVITLICIIVFNVVYCVNFSSKRNIPAARSDKVISRTVANPLLLIGVSSAAALSILAYNGFSVISMFVRGGMLTSRADFGGPLTLVYRNFIYPIPCICVIFYALFGKRRIMPMLILLALFLFANFPTGTARFQAGAMYISALLALFPSLRANNIIIPAFMLLGIAIVFPTLDQFRFYEGNFSVRTLDFNGLTAGHFDSFQSIAGALQMEITWGHQLLGVLLFWVPRSIWADKPVGSGAYYAGTTDLTLNNISMNFFGEGIINFGMIGAVIFAAIVGFVFSAIDRRRQWPNHFPVYAIVSIFLIGFAFFIMRGDLMSSFAYTVGNATSIYMINKICTKRIS